MIVLGLVGGSTSKRECGAARKAYTAAAPATVSGEHLSSIHSRNPGGRRKGASTRKPGDLPGFGSTAVGKDGKEDKT
jgi:hypothetical protein